MKDRSIIMRFSKELLRDIDEMYGVDLVEEVCEHLETYTRTILHEPTSDTLVRVEGQIVARNTGSDEVYPHLLFATTSYKRTSG